MGGVFARPSLIKVGVSVLTGLAVFAVTWLYLNSYYTLNIEDELFNKEVFIKHKLLNIRPKKNKQFVFISTGKDLSLVNDNKDYGNITVSDRFKLLKFLRAINAAPVKPEYVLIDLQFYYPFSFTGDDSLQRLANASKLKDHFPDRSVDSAMQAEISKLKKVAITVLLDSGRIDTPIYKANYGIADYKTYGDQLNKFRLNYAGLHALSIPALLHQKMDGAVYSGGQYSTFCSGRLCFNYIWPGYYYDNDAMKNDTTYQSYHIGMLTGLPNYEEVIGGIIKDKVVCIGNFEDDTHPTPNGDIYGTLILADIYLSLLNGDHYVPYTWIVFVILIFSGLSYIAIYNKLPDVKLNFSFALAKHASGFINKYISFIGVLTLLSILSVLLFNMMVSLFLPAFIFSIIDYFVKRKYKLNEQ